MTEKKSITSVEKCYRVLTKVQSTSAIAFTTFAVIHGAQITAASVGCTDMADNWLLLGRPLYQDQYLETLVVTGAVTVHVLAGVSKALIRHQWWQQPWLKSSRHTWTGYLLIPVLGAHYTLTRYLPARYFGDSAFVDFSLITWGLQNRPALTYALHGTLIGLGTYHFVGGITRIAKSRTLKTTSSKPLHRSMGTTAMATVAGISAILIAGLITIGRTTKIPLRQDFSKIYKQLLFG